MYTEKMCWISSAEIRENHKSVMLESVAKLKWDWLRHVVGDKFTYEPIELFTGDHGDIREELAVPRRDELMTSC